MAGAGWNRYVGTGRWLALVTAAVFAVTAPNGCSGPANAPATGVPRGEAGYQGSVQRIDAGLSARMRFSHRSGCPVPLSDLRYLRMAYVGFDGRRHVGEMVVHEKYADAVVAVFKELYAARWPIRRMRLVDDYEGDDDRSMAADNTSAYNCRPVAGTDRWSQHAYGAAVDINPLENPYLTASVAPPEGRRFSELDRSPGARLPAGVIGSDSVVVAAFARVGWTWGGTWTYPKDYQHFSAAAR